MSMADWEVWDNSSELELDCLLLAGLQEWGLMEGEEDSDAGSDPSDDKMYQGLLGSKKILRGLPPM